mgnify:CR=1 FL=1
MANSPEAVYKEADAESGEIRDLVLDHVPLVHRLADRLSMSTGHEQYRQDLVGAGMLGLVQAAHRFDPSLGNQFITFAYPRVRGAMVDFLRSNDILGRSARERLQGIRQAIESFRSLHARKPTVTELSRQTGLEEDEIVRCLTHEKLESMASLEAPAAEGDSQGCLAELIPAQTSTPLSKLEWAEQVELLAAAIEALPEREKRIIVLYYYEDLYMAEMAEIMGISESRVSQLHTRALYNLTRIMGEDDGR